MVATQTCFCYVQPKTWGSKIPILTSIFFKGVGSTVNHQAVRDVRCNCPTGHEELGCEDSTDPSSSEPQIFLHVRNTRVEEFRNGAMMLIMNQHSNMFSLGYLGFLLGWLYVWNFLYKYIYIYIRFTLWTNPSVVLPQLEDFLKTWKLLFHELWTWKLILGNGHP